MTENDIVRWREAVGPRADRYLKVFERIEAKGGRWVPGWNFAAFFHSTAWFCCRRMYGSAFVNLFALPGLVIVLATVGHMISPGGNLDMAFLVLVAVYCVVVFGLVPVFADSIYYRSLREKIQTAVPDLDVSAHRPTMWTGFGAACLGFVWVLMVLSAMIPSYGDYTPRAKVSEAFLAGSMMRREISEFFLDKQRLPRADEVTQYQAPSNHPPSQRVESIVYEPGSRSIVITMRDPFPGRKIAFLAEIRNGALVWTCRSIDIEEKHVPPSCRKGSGAEFK